MEVMKLTGGKLERVIVCHDSFQKEKIAIDFILILVVH